MKIPKKILINCIGNSDVSRKKVLKNIWNSEIHDTYSIDFHGNFKIPNKIHTVFKIFVSQNEIFNITRIVEFVLMVGKYLKKF